MWSALTIVVALVAVALVGLRAIQNVGPSEYRRRLSQMMGLWPINSTVTITATVSSTSPTLTAPSSVAGIMPGMTISGANITAGTTVVAVSNASGGTVTMSADGASSATGATVSFAFASGSAEVHLMAANYSGGNDPTPASFTEAAAAWYSAADVSTYTPVYNTSTGGSEIDFGLFSWVLTTTPVTATTVYGYWVDYLYPGAGGTRVVSCYELFATPVPMTEPGNSVVLSIPINLPGPGSASQV